MSEFIDDVLILDQELRNNSVKIWQGEGNPQANMFTQQGMREICRLRYDDSLNRDKVFVLLVRNAEPPGDHLVEKCRQEALRLFTAWCNPRKR